MNWFIFREYNKMAKKSWGGERELPGNDAEKEEIALYKERLKEMEIAFRYNLNLLAERDAELDIIEEQLRSGIVQLERVSQEKTDCEEVLKLVHEEKAKETRLLKKKLIEQENANQELERKNCGNVRTLRKALEKARQEQQEEKERAENFIRMIQLKENVHLEELRRIEMKHAKKLDESARERHRLFTENRNLRKQLAVAEQKEWSEIVRMQHMQRLCDGVGEQSTGMHNRETMTECTLTHAGTQTANGDDVESKLLLEQNDVLKRIIKNLKRKMKCGGGRDCGEWESFKEKLEETNKRFEAEIIRVKKEVERERSEEEAIIQSLERSVSSLKDKLLKSLIVEGDHVKLEHRLNQKLEKIDKKLEELRKRVETGACAIPSSNVGNNKFH